ncbi:TolC family protein [soil metagenome]
MNPFVGWPWAGIRRGAPRRGMHSPWARKPGGSFIHSCVAIGVVAALTGCASLAPDGGNADVQALVAGNPLVAGSAARPSADAASQRNIDALLDQPLDAEAAVRIALVNSPRVQEAFATLQLSDADRVQAASLPNPLFGFGRLREGRSLEIDRSLSFNVLGLITLPWQARWAGQRHEVAKLQAAQSVLQIAADTRRAWVRAVAAQQAVVYLRDAEAAAEAGAELAQRMAKAGNWSALQRSREALLLAEASTQLARAEQAALAAREQLTQLLGLTGAQADYRLPDRLPALPPALPTLTDVQASAMRDRLDVRAAQAQTAATAEGLGLSRATRFVDALEIGGARNTTFDRDVAGSRSTQRGAELSLPIPLFDWGLARDARAEALYLQSAARVRAVGVQAASEAREAYGGWQNAWAIARRHQAELLPLRRQVNDEMVLRYNGMLASVWDLLAETRASMLAVNAAMNAQRDFWLADTDLQLALTGSSPAGATALQATGDNVAAAPAGAH